MTAVLVVGTMDTKGRECAYLADRIRELGCEVVVMDVGILGEADEIRCDITRRAVAEAAGTTLEALRHAGSRGKAVEGMREGARRIARRLAGEARIHGAISLGGAEGAACASEARGGRGAGRRPGGPVGGREGACDIDAIPPARTTSYSPQTSR